MGNISSPEQLRLRWAELVGDPVLSDLPYKIEVNLWGKVEMTPATFWHGRMQAAVAAQLAQQLPEGEALTEVPVLTEIGVRVPDVAWGSREYLAANADASPAPRAPEICVEIVSQSNSDDEIRAKVRAYLAAGAQEVWVLSEDGDMRVHDAHGERHASAFRVRLSLPTRGVRP
jgi:Uma2 family endonuclease